MPRIDDIQVRRGTAAEWATVDPVLDLAEPGLETDTDKVKYGDGVSAWSALPYSSGGGGGAVDSVNSQTGVVVLDAADVGADPAGAAADAQAYAIQRANHTGVQAQSTVTGLVADLAAKADLVGGLVPTSQLPAIAFTTVQVVANRAAMLALTNVQPGDVVVISGTADQGTYVLAATDPTVFANWVLLKTPLDAVLTVNSQTGNVVLGFADVGADAAGAAAAAQAASQPLDGDLTAIAALTTTTYGRAFLALADAAAARTALALGTAATQNTGAFDAAGAAAAAQAASQPLDSDLTAIAALTTTAFGRSFLDRADAAAGRTLLGLGTAATQNTGAFDAAGAAAAAQAASQPVDSDLTAIAALTTTSFGRGLLTLADAAAGRTALGLGTAAVANTGDFDAAGAAASAQAAAIAASQPVDSDLTAIAALTTTPFGRGLLTQADAAATRTTLGLGTAATQNTGAFDAAGAATAAQAASQPLDSDLTAIAALTTTSYGRSFLALADAAAARTLTGLVIGTNVQAWDTDLDAIAALTTTTFGRALLTMADAAATKTALALVKADVGLGSVDNTADTAKPVSTAQQTALDLKADKSKTINSQTGTTYTLVLTDAGKWVELANAGAITFTVPPNSSVAFPVGTQIEGMQTGAGQVTITAGAGVTINGTPGLKVAAQYGSFGLIKVATDTWRAYGRLSS